MQSRSDSRPAAASIRLLPGLFGFAVLWGLSATTLRAGDVDEKALLAIWKQHSDAPQQHAEIAAACRQFERDYALSFCVPVARGLAAWHQLAGGQTDAAVTNLTAMLSADREPIPKAANQMALRWLTRLDREKVSDALSAVYAVDVAFPDSLAPLKKLPAARQPPLADRWGQAWHYRLTAFKYLKGLVAQRYVLESAALGDGSDLHRALKIPYGSRIYLKPVNILAAAGAAQTVAFETTGDKPEPVVLSEDAAYLRITFVALTPNLLLLSDGDHWKLLSPPAGGGSP
jgi:hypothetical protein